MLHWDESLCDEMILYILGAMLRIQNLKNKADIERCLCLVLLS